METEIELTIRNLQQRIAELEKQATRSRDPLRRMFLAKRTTEDSPTWKEYTVENGGLVEFASGRRSATLGHSTNFTVAMDKLLMDAVLVMEVEDYDGSDRVNRYLPFTARDRSRTVWINGDETGGGYYAGKIAVRTSTFPDPTTDLVLGNLLHGTGDDALIINAFESGTGTHTLFPGITTTGVFIGWTNEATPRQMVVIDRPPFATMFYVYLTKTGGSDGTSTTKASYTYSAQTLAFQAIPGTDFAPGDATRSVGSVSPAPVGLGFLNEAGFTLVRAYESAL